MTGISINLGMARPPKHPLVLKFRENNNSGITGVWWDNTRKYWRVFISVDKVRKYIGYHSNKFDACAIKRSYESNLIKQGYKLKEFNGGISYNSAS